MQKLYHENRRSIAYIAVETTNGLESIGTAFHIGQGYFVTAKHVVQNNKIIEVGITQPLSPVKDYHSLPLSDSERPLILKIISEPVLAAGEIDDVAIFQVEQYESIPAVKLDSIHDIHQSEDLALLSNVLCIGYPPIPLTIHPFQVAVDATVSALINIRGSDYLSYIVSATARGGFSGGPIISKEGKAIGIITESLVRDNNAVETGFMSCLSIAAVANLALSCGWSPDEWEYYQDIESLASIKLALPHTKKLNPHAHDMKIYVYDDDRDVFVEISCFNERHRELAVNTFNSMCPLHAVEAKGPNLFATPIDNPSSALLKQASKNTRDALLAAGYCLVRERFSDGWHE